MKQTSPLPGSEAWYQAMTDEQLNVRISQSMPKSRDWEAAKRVIDDRASRRKDRRNLWLTIAGIVVGLVSVIVAVLLR